MRQFSTLTLSALLLLFGAACAEDPAAHAPDAQVAEPAAESEPAADAAPAADEVVLAISDDSSIGFVGSKVTGSHDGGFSEFDGEIVLVGDTAEGSSVDVNIDTTSLWADNERLTGHLKSADFFEVETYPTASFKSSSVTGNDDGTFTVTGNLTLHGVTKQITFPATIEVEGETVRAQSEFSIKRFDFGIEYKGKADDLIRDEVLVKLDLKAGPEAAGAATEPAG